MARNLHSFTLTDDASMEVKRMKKGSKSHQVSIAIMKYSNDYKLTPDGVKFWQDLCEQYRSRANDEERRAKLYLRVNRELREQLYKQGFKYHLGELLRCLIPFPRRKQVDQQEQ
jgi:hypothetical protein